MVHREGPDGITPETVIDKIVQQVAELPDRTSPEGWPEAMLVTSTELRAILSHYLSAPPVTPGEPCGECRTCRNGNGAACLKRAT